MELNEFTAEALRPHVGSVFHVNADSEQPVDLVLDEVKVVIEKHHSPRMKRDSFSLFFNGPQNLYMPQSTYAISHDALGGPWPIFIVPVGRKENGVFMYEAVFT